ncbi:MAG: tetratricopeptide repeat protein [Cyanobacteria bacterium]|nr:tetratricopeptide repeat protein [Cyanobacteriota bacterium]
MTLNLFALHDVALQVVALQKDMTRGVKLFPKQAIGVGSLVLIALSFQSYFPQAWAIEEHSFKHYQAGVLLERQGNLRQASEEYRMAIAQDPFDSLNYIKLASVLAQLGNTHEAISLYQKAASMDSQDPMVYLSMGALYEQLGNYPKAEEAYHRVVVKAPSYQFGLLNLARTQAQQGQSDINHYQEAIGNYQLFLQRYPDHYEARRHLARILLVVQREPEAVKEFEILKAKFPQKFNEHLYFAKALTRSNAPEKALEELKQAYASEGNKADISEEIGNAHRALGQYKYAIQNYDKAVTLNPAKTDLYLNLGDLYLKTQQTDQAIGSYQQYLKTDPGNTDVHQSLAAAFLEKKEYRSALEELNTVEPKITDPDQRFQVAKQIAYAYQMSGNFDQAIPRYESLLKDPRGTQETQLKINLAIAYHQKDRLEEAAVLYKELYDQDPKKNQAFGNDLANVYSTLGDRAYQAQKYEMALTHYTQGEPYAGKDNVRPLLGIANTYLAQNLTAQALQGYQKVLDKDPSNVFAKLYESKIIALQPVILGNSNTGAFNNALTNLQKLVDAHQENVEVQVVAAEVYARLQRYPEAIGAYEKLVKLQPNNEHLYIALGNLWEHSGSVDKAIQAYQQAIGVNGQNPTSHYNLATLLQGKGQLGESIEEYRKVLALDPQFNDANYGLAVALEKQNRLPEALQTFEVYLSKPAGTYFTEASQRVGILKGGAGGINPITPTPQNPAHSSGIVPAGGTPVPQPSSSFGSKLQANPSPSQPSSLELRPAIPITKP